MNKRMLIDTTHAEETRVVVMDGNRLEDYDVEASAKKQLKGNIYLAKVIRVEPSLQAAFVEYGGNRHGFLAFSEIHPDYYQIPVADREKLLALQEEEARIDEAQSQDDDAEAPAEPAAADAQADGDAQAADGEAEPLPETVGGETDTGDESLVQRRIARFLRNYKIQEVIRRRQILLVQVVKEERGNKGAALTTYISLAGRYCVLMPNSLRGGGVSRKITSVADRRRLKDVIAELQIPRGMAMIVRTAGAQRPRPEIMRDCEYLLRLWDDIRDHTMHSVAPALIYEEASLIKRAIRDIYTRDVGEILVDGEAGWKSAREFMRMLMPQSAPKVKCWRDGGQPLFSHFNVEGLLDSMLSPTVQLRSGGYLVINQAEALVAIDVNSGRATRERNIEETALRTNLEAAEEVARQLRLRDLAGLIVIDFIDMESRKHNGMVERRLKDALRTDRARIQVGAISHFGLLEMSRQRLRPSIAESTFTPCPHCQGTGIIRGTESAALHVLRAVEEEGARRRAAEITVHVAAEIALYILNNKRAWLSEIEKRHKMHVVFSPDASLLPPQLRIERVRPQTERFEPVAPPVLAEPTDILAEETEAAAPVVREIPIQAEAPADAAVAAEAAPVSTEEGEEGTDHRRRRRRRRRRRGGERAEGAPQAVPAEAADAEQADEDAGHGNEGEEETVPTIHAESVPEPAPAREEGGRDRNRRRRDRQDRRPAQPAAPPAQAPYRGPTPANPFGDGILDIFDVIEQSTEAPQAPVRRPEPNAMPADIVDVAETLAVSEPEAVPAIVEAEIVIEAAPVEAAPVEAEPVEVEAETVETPAKPRRRTRARKSAVAEAMTAEAPDSTTEPAPVAAEAEEPAKPKRRRAATPRKTAAKAAAEEPTVADSAPPATAEAVPAEDAAEAAPKKPTRKRTTRATTTTRARKAKPAEDAATEADATEAAEPAPEAPAKPRRTRKAPARAKAAAKPQAEAEAEATAEATPEAEKTAPVVQPIVIDDSKPAPARKTGWWRR
ncbi:ribonuclease, Rne/Rng family [Gluconacetobacter diazotrophicus PA1 5]|uniref:Ribonuclease E n=1 Tax=Gluconacetobacter diazotrophicus TaxID=33996 RepID=A0A7W4FF49_GLUDI|nr:ribonuclease E/G [Gluconacetobacter diazotrophicus]ACI50381.1 ribonuclease, Rne/Rng family [Gluconacetobacter diazotrophicus PA1 5]MBB2156359.1 ribonuclease E/G [Gluconacetobacter diazotrophicus]TWB08324.1 ribonuclease E [Gluconacetobacter diazotrophicus]